MTLPRSEAIVGSAVARIVWSRTAGSIASTIAANGNRMSEEVLMEKVIATQIFDTT